MEYWLTPVELLQEDTIYAMTIRLSQITDNDGNPLGTTDVMIIFSTGDDPIPSFVGVLDTTFGNSSGYITGPTLGAFDNKFGMALDADDNVYYLEGYNEPKGFTVRKYDSQGNSDTSFGADGTLDGTDSGNKISVILVNNDDLFLFGSDENAQLKLLKYSIDGSFVASETYAVVDTHPYDAKVDSNGNIVITGRSGNFSSDLDIILWRYTPLLSLDSTFGTGGVVTYEYAGSDSMGSIIVSDSAGSLYVHGAVTDDGFSTTTAVIVVKFDSSGNVVNSFGNSGVVGFDDYGPGGMIIDSSDNIFVGLLNSQEPCQVASEGVKIDTGGNIDTSFGSSGIFNFGGDSVGIGGADTDGDDNFIASTYACSGGSSTPDEMVVWNVNGNTGALITASGDDGKVTFDNFEAPYPRTVVMDSEGRFLVCLVDFEGVWGSTSPPFYIMRAR